MKALLRFAGWIDQLNRIFGWVATAGVLVCCLVSTGNALSRYAFSLSSNAWLEIQWYIFAGIVMLGAAVTLARNEHVRVDVLYGRLPARGKAWADLLGLLIFLMPAMLTLLYFSAPYFLSSWNSQEYSSNEGGLIIWPARLMLPLGFLLVCLQGVSEIIKRIGYLRGEYEMDTHYERPLQ
ncbi:TRAP transporter small permease subunit [Uliginosibacterium sp. H3]|uniref:TRAP transporter small permease protein n=1 Tax=Uliginosibacterium silvisoli TaxID=3114758 RepID=A0ABU6K926_9RHOO|nr:TRAP transporter small permease subunit [Uliginosibacterium sp. H3]